MLEQDHALCKSMTNKEDKIACQHANQKDGVFKLEGGEQMLHWHS